MNRLIITKTSSIAHAAGLLAAVVFLVQCDKPSVSVSSGRDSDVEEVETLAPPPPQPLAEVIHGTWIAHKPESLPGVEKVQVDFHANGSVTMILYNPAEFATSGSFEVKGDALTIQFEGDDQVTTAYDGEVLTMTSVESPDQEVSLKKL